MGVGVMWRKAPSKKKNEEKSADAYSKRMKQMRETAGYGTRKAPGFVGKKKK